MLKGGAGVDRFDQLPRRFLVMFKYAVGQWRLFSHPLAGIAHSFIFLGAGVLLIRGLILFGRGYSADPFFGYGILDGGSVSGDWYSLIKDVAVVLVVIGVIVFFLFRVILGLERLTLNFEGLLILFILMGLMVTDVVYDGANIALHRDIASVWEPLGSALSPLVKMLPVTGQKIALHIGFWGHVCLILGFLNYLPYCKQFHEITGFPNVFFRSLDPPGRLSPMTDIEGMAERGEALGLAGTRQLSWKSILDLYTCSECGRCSEQCPAARTGKTLSPKELTTGIRDQLLGRNQGVKGDAELVGDDLAVGIDALWACTTCRACEDACPLFISYVDKIVDMRRYQVQEKGEMPDKLAAAFRNTENSGNPWGFPARDRTRWADGLHVPLVGESEKAEWLLWVGCAAAYDDRAAKSARAVARLLDEAGVSFAILGQEENCTGDFARRAGNEFLFQMQAAENIETINGYGIKKIVAICPHCYNTLKNEYCDFGGCWEVMHYTDLLAELIECGRLNPTHEVTASVVYHDSCYLGRYNGKYESPRRILDAIPGVKLVETEENRDKGLCCGAGGAQYFKEEEAGEKRVGRLRAEQLLGTGADTVGSSCPFCISTLADAISALGESPHQADIAEILLASVEGDGSKGELNNSNVPRATS